MKTEITGSQPGPRVLEARLNHEKGNKMHSAKIEVHAPTDTGSAPAVPKPMRRSTPRTTSARATSARATPPGQQYTYRVRIAGAEQPNESVVVATSLMAALEETQRTHQGATVTSISLIDRI